MLNKLNMNESNSKIKIPDASTFFNSDKSMQHRQTKVKEKKLEMMRIRYLALAV